METIKNLLTEQGEEVKKFDLFDLKPTTKAYEIVYIGAWDSDPESNRRHEAKVLAAESLSTAYIEDGDNRFAVLFTADEAAVFWAEQADKYDALLDQENYIPAYEGD